MRINKTQKEKRENYFIELTKMIFKFIFFGKINYYTDDNYESCEYVIYDMDSVFPSKEIEKKVIKYLKDGNNI